MEAPGYPPGILYSQIGAETPTEVFVSIFIVTKGNVKNLQKYTKCRPHLPSHDKSSTDNRRRVFSSIDGDSGGLCTHSDTKKYTRDEELPPILGEGGSNDRKQAEDSSDEDGSATTDDVIERVGKPAATVRRRKFDI